MTVSAIWTGICPPAAGVGGGQGSQPGFAVMLDEAAQEATTPAIDRALDGWFDLGAIERDIEKVIGKVKVSHGPAPMTLEKAMKLIHAAAEGTLQLTFDPDDDNPVVLRLKALISALDGKGEGKLSAKLRQILLNYVEAYRKARIAAAKGMLEMNAAADVATREKARDGTATATATAAPHQIGSATPVAERIQAAMAPEAPAAPTQDGPPPRPLTNRAFLMLLGQTRQEALPAAPPQFISSP